MTIFGVFNIKGGVGKTATAINLAYLVARAGHPTLLWDLDPQGAASFTMRTRARVRGGGRRVVEGRVVIDELIRGSDYAHLDVVPADLSNRKIDDALGARTDPRGAFLEALRPAKAEYDHIFLDCAPALSQLSECIFSSADVLLCPTIPTPLSLRTLAQLMKHLKRRDGTRPVVLPFFCMVDRRKALHRQTCDWAFEQDLGFMRTTIPYSSDVEQMSSKREPLFCYAPGSKSARAYEELWREVCTMAPSQDDARRLYAKSARKALEQAARTRESRRDSTWRPPDKRPISPE